ncbi:uncharacterized protein B0T23DRAFT_392488 [Neurospora hispaniola]|uniref:Uncharacterized protein n=1 Tax=Neurospora hispaniola TaxID=588809 RepID=A0AAJ0MVP1_9PEZI|nr:hypothetical protein B0T23DRAFT_392488 [Neurospora hispaniola]
MLGRKPGTSQRFDWTTVDGRREERGSLQNRAVAALKLLNMALVMSLQYVPSPTCPFDATRIDSPAESWHAFGMTQSRDLTGMASRCERFSSSLIHCITALLLATVASPTIPLLTYLNVISLTTSRQRQSGDKQPESVDGLALATRVPGLAETTYRL